MRFNAVTSRRRFAITTEVMMFFFALADMDDYRARYEASLRARFADSDVYCCGAWCQGISLAQTFAMLDAGRLASLRHNSADYNHYLVETCKLAFADRERYIADPTFVDVPVVEMLDDAYLRQRSALIDPAHAFDDMPPAGDPRCGEALLRTTGDATERTLSDRFRFESDAHASVPHDSCLRTDSRNGHDVQLGIDNNQSPSLNGLFLPNFVRTGKLRDYAQDRVFGYV